MQDVVADYSLAWPKMDAQYPGIFLVENAVEGVDRLARVAFLNPLDIFRSLAKSRVQAPGFSIGAEYRAAKFVPQQNTVVNILGYGEQSRLAKGCCPRRVLVANQDIGNIAVQQFRQSTIAGILAAMQNK